GIESCPIKALYGPPAASQRRCAGSVVGRGTVDSEVLLEGEEVPIEGTLTAFYGREDGQARMLGQVIASHGTSKLIYVLPFLIEQERGRFGTKLAIPQMRFVLGKLVQGANSYTFPYGYGRISTFSLSLKRSFPFAGRWRSFVTASCPAPKGRGSVD